MVLDPVSCPAKILCTAVSALRNSKFSRLGGWLTTSLHTLLRFRYWLNYVACMRDLADRYLQWRISAESKPSPTIHFRIRSVEEAKSGSDMVAQQLKVN